MRCQSLPVPVKRWHIARWRVGLAVAPGVPGRSLEALLARGMAIAQREPGAASQQAFERARLATGTQTPSTGPTATGHLEAARLAATTLGGAGVTNETAAHAFDLRFLALEDHVVELWAAERWDDHPGISALAELLNTTAFIERVAHYGGYDLAHCGEPAQTSKNLGRFVGHSPETAIPRNPTQAPPCASPPQSQPRSNG